jgi:predicted O-methyltransferase YrrM
VRSAHGLPDPSLVRRAPALERELGFERSCIREVPRRLVRVDAAQGPFDLLFLDSGKQHPELDGEDVVGLLAPGATIVMDDLTAQRRRPDPVREFWLNHPRIAALEILTTPTTGAIVGTLSG